MKKKIVNTLLIVLYLKSIDYGIVYYHKAVMPLRMIQSFNGIKKKSPECVSVLKTTVNLNLSQPFFCF